ncbi:hypothetical protein [Planctopirus ephydatiae]|uniref:hypothetical protein n=1 Tax=Planctopirus ephydatiae TaxID=2528019 RepID=UPI001643D305|nr:hypothetical protein [Planctopirus ephydatiae]
MSQTFVSANAGVSSRPANPFPVDVLAASVHQPADGKKEFAASGKKQTDQFQNS